MLFEELHVCTLDEIHTLVGKSKGVVFVSAKGKEGINMPLNKIRDGVTSSLSDAIFVPVTGNWKKQTDILGKDLALQFKIDTRSPHPLILSVLEDRNDKFAKKKISDAFKNSAEVVLQKSVSDTKLKDIRSVHFKTSEILDKGRNIKIFLESQKKHPKLSKICVDARSSFMIFDQAKHYLAKEIVSAIVSMSAKLVSFGKNEPFIVTYGDEMGIVTNSGQGYSIITPRKHVAIDTCVKKTTSKTSSKRCPNPLQNPIRKRCPNLLRKRSSNLIRNRCQNLLRNRCQNQLRKRCQNQFRKRCPNLDNVIVTFLAINPGVYCLDAIFADNTSNPLFSTKHKIYLYNLEIRSFLLNQALSCSSSPTYLQICQ